MKKAFIYVRVSSKGQEDGYSLEAQLKYLREHAADHGYTVVQEFVEVASAKRTDRSQFNAMLKTLETDRSVQNILVEKTDRLFRNLFDYGRVNQLMNMLGITVHLVKETEVLSKDSRSHKKTTHGFKALMAQDCIDNLSEETKKGMLEKAEQRIYPSWAPFGYINCEKSGKRDIELHPKEAPFVGQIFELAAADYSIAKIAQIVAKEGMTCRNGQPPYHSLIAKILKNKFYTGVFLWKGQLYKNASHKALVSEERFELVQKMVSKPNKQKSRKGLFAYTNLIVCGACGSAITAEIKKERYIYYHCTNNECSKVCVREEVIEERVVELLQMVHIPDETHDAICTIIRETTQNEIEYHLSAIGRIEKQLKILQNRKKQSYEAMLDKKIAEEFWKERDAEWGLQEEQLVASLLEHHKAKIDCTNQVDLMLTLPSKAAHLFKHGSVEQKRKIVNLIFSTCVLRGKNLELELKDPFNLIITTSRETIIK